MTGFATAAAVGTEFLFVVCMYTFWSLSYSFFLKNIAVVDVITLASLFTLRIFAGSVATDINITRWLLAFSTFLFLALDACKRLQEIVTVLSDNNKGATTRPYTGYDKNFMVALALSSCNISGVVFALYLNSPQVSLLYSNPDYLWITFVALILGASWMALQAYRGQMAHDPIIFIIYDKVFLICLILSLVSLTLAW